jgi:hypothetical protein
MTTNRVGFIDEAIFSRIHFSIHYPPLNKEAAKEIWRALLSRIKNGDGDSGPKIIFNETELLNYIEGKQVDLNGRQIGNAARTAVALAKEEASSMNPADASDSPDSTDSFHKIPGHVQLECRHFELIFALSAQFDKYLQSIREEGKNERARNYYRRNDNFNDTVR